MTMTLAPGISPVYGAKRVSTFLARGLPASAAAQTKLKIASSAKPEYIALILARASRLLDSDYSAALR
jgi:hypothetical protein